MILTEKLSLEFLFTYARDLRREQRPSEPHELAADIVHDELENAMWKVIERSNLVELLLVDMEYYELHKAYKNSCGR